VSRTLCDQEDEREMREIQTGASRRAAVAEEVLDVTRR
jgi:hypothetical protein